MLSNSFSVELPSSAWIDAVEGVEVAMRFPSGENAAV